MKIAARTCRPLLLALVWLLLCTAPAEAGQFTVMTLGDSIVTGAEGNFRTPLKALLAADGIGLAFVGREIDADGNRHEGHGGWTPSELLHGKWIGLMPVSGAAPWLERNPADIYILYAGLNGMTPKNLAPGPEGWGPHVAAMRGLLDAIRAVNPAAQVVLAQIGRVLAAGPEPNASIATFNRQLAVMAAAYGHQDRVRLARLENVFADDPGMYVDHGHPGRKGNEALAAGLRPYVRAAAKAATWNRTLRRYGRPALGLVVVGCLAWAGVLVRRCRPRR